MRVDSSWSFKDLVSNIKRLKEEYIFFLAFFSSKNDIESKRIQNIYIKKVRDSFYAININERQIDVAWEYMNDYVTYQDLFYYLSLLDKRKKK